MAQKDLLEIYNTYKNNLCNRIFRYVYINKTTKTDETVDIRFFSENFCHLLGIQHVYKGKQYLGKSGVKRIESGKITFDTMKRHNRQAFNHYKTRFYNFDMIEEVLYYAKLLRFYPSRVKPQTEIQAEFVVVQNKKQYYLHLFLVQERHRGIYVPRSFVVTSEKDRNAKRFFVGQEEKRIKEFKVILCEEQKAD